MKKFNHYILQSLLLLFINSPSYANENKLSLTVKISGATPGKAQMIMSVFTSPESYLKKPLISKNKAVDDNGEVTFVLENLNPGKYSVSIIYDEDNNGKLNTGFLGIPNEPVGFSNNARGTFGPPSYDDTSFNLFESKSITISLINADE